MARRLSFLLGGVGGVLLLLVVGASGRKRGGDARPAGSMQKAHPEEEQSSEGFDTFHSLMAVTPQSMLALKAKVAAEMQGRDDAETIEVDTIDAIFPGSTEPKHFQIPHFLTATLKRFELIQERQEVHHWGPEVVEAAEKIHEDWPGSRAIVAQHLIIKEDSRQTRAQHASTIVQVGNGDMLAAWFGGQWEKQKDVGIWMSRFTDGEWAADAWQVVPPSNASEPCWNPVLLHLSDPDETLLFYKVGSDTKVWRTYIKRSFDNGKSWGEPEALREGYVGPAKNKPIVLKDGTILAGSSDENNGWTVHVEASKDRGRSWWKGPDIRYATRHLIQPTLFETPTGIRMLIRSKDGVVVGASSSDKIGILWNEAFPTHLPNPNSGIDSVVLPDGRVLLVYNPQTEMRNRLAVGISVDSGHHFTLHMMLEDADDELELPTECQDPDGGAIKLAKMPEYSYPAVVLDSDGMAHITYTYSYFGAKKKCSGRENIKHIILDPQFLW